MILRAVRRTSMALAVATALLPAVFSAQTASPQAPPRDASIANQTAAGTATVRGRVLDAESGRPLRRARLSLTAPGIPPQQAITASTDADGRYEFTELTARQYTLTAQRSGYLTLRFGQRRPNEQGRVLDVGNGQMIENINFALPRMGVISGRVTDEFGEPIAGVWVAPLRLMWFQNRRQLASESRLATTDEDGEYRLIGLNPGSYVVVARTLEKWTDDTSGREQTMSYAPSYYPGVSDVTQASRV